MTEYRAGETGGPLLKALLALCQFHGREVHPEALINGLPLTQGRLSPSVFARAASRARFSSRILKRALPQMNKALLPAILLLRDEKVCVLLRMDLARNQAEVIYPELEQAAVTVSLEDLARDYSGSVIYCRPDFSVEPRRADFDTNTRLHWFWGVIGQNKRLYRDIILAAVVINLFAIAMPLFVMNVYDRVVPNAATATLWVLATGLLTVLVADLILKLMRGWFVDLAASRADIRLSSRIMERVLAMQLKDRPQASGAFAANISSFESVRNFIGSLTIVSIADFPFVLLFVLIIGWINLFLVIPIIIGSLLILLYALISQHNMHALSESAMQAGAQRNAGLVESIGNLEAVKSFNVQSDVQSRWEEATIFLSRNAAKMRMVSSSVSNGAAFVQQVAGLSIIIIGVYLLIAGQLTQGGLIAAYLLSSRAMAPVSQAAALLAQYHQAATAMETLNEIMQRPAEYDDARQKLDRPIIRGDIEFRNVVFNYPEMQQPALNQVSFKIKAGEHVGILGKNGSGKSTLEKLIMGLYQPAQGSVLIDGVDMRQLDVTQLRRNIGYVPQDVSLFQGSLKHNIVLTSYNEDAERLLKVTSLTGLGAMISQHPEGIGMQVGERGQHLSGGQRQSVAIARALLNDPPVLILDEPTASLDHASEDQIKRNLEELARGKTLMLITHRSSLLALVDRLIVIDQGKIVADGPKETVMEALRQGRISGAS